MNGAMAGGRGSMSADNIVRQGKCDFQVIPDLVTLKANQEANSDKLLVFDTDANSRVPVDNNKINDVALHAPLYSMRGKSASHARSHGASIDVADQSSYSFVLSGLNGQKVREHKNTLNLMKNESDRRHALKRKLKRDICPMGFSAAMHPISSDAVNMGTGASRLPRFVASKGGTMSIKVDEDVQPGDMLYVDLPSYDYGAELGLHGGHHGQHNAPAYKRAKVDPNPGQITLVVRRQRFWEGNDAVGDAAAPFRPMQFVLQHVGHRLSAQKSGETLTDQECLAVLIALTAANNASVQQIIDGKAKKMTDVYHTLRAELQKPQFREEALRAIRAICEGEHQPQQLQMMMLMHVWSTQMLEEANRWRVGRATRQAKAGEKTDVVFCNT